LAGLLLRRFSRRTLVLCLVLLLTIFAFENALHSVHHGFDAKQGDTCTLAMASTHLSAVTVDGIVETTIVLVATGHATPAGRSPLPANWLGADRGRAPPAQAA
jgi:fumarate reductase subunit D